MIKGLLGGHTLADQYSCSSCSLQQPLRTRSEVDPIQVKQELTQEFKEELG